MKRRIFLQRSGTAGIGLFVASIVTTIGLTLSGGCSSSNSGGSDDESDDDGALFTVDFNGHTHSFLIPQAILDTPPVGGFTDSTSLRNGHTHMVTLSQANIQDIVASMAVAGNTTVAEGHSHSYNFA